MKYKIHLLPFVAALCFLLENIEARLTNAHGFKIIHAYLHTYNKNLEC
uniref:Uncharacterized protein n=1 Tax=Arundo donax TaxID=35708 RepID=A0A0A9H8A2_ARUDO